MNTPPEIPPVLGPIKTISYEFTRGDFFLVWMTGIFRSRILLIFLTVLCLLNEWMLYKYDYGKFSLPVFLIAALIHLVGFIVLFTLIMAVMGLAFTFLLKHRSVITKHVLEITEQGLIERTDYNEGLHRWSAIGRILSLCGYLYVYVSDTNCHAIPKRCFPAAEIDSFEAELRRRATGAKSR
jgi:hypothetical protein